MSGCSCHINPPCGWCVDGFCERCDRTVRPENMSEDHEGVCFDCANKESEVRKPLITIDHLELGTEFVVLVCLLCLAVPVLAYVSGRQPDAYSKYGRLVVEGKQQSSEGRALYDLLKGEYK